MKWLIYYVNSFVFNENICDFYMIAMERML